MRNLRAPRTGKFDLANSIFSIFPFTSSAVKRPIEKMVTRSATVDKGGRYSIPQGGGFKYVSNPQYLGELVGWFAWCLWSYNPGGVVVFLISVVNLVPRAFEQHKWYKNKFDNYPAERKALIPFIM